MSGEAQYEVFPAKRTFEDTEATAPEQFVWHFRDANGDITHVGGQSFTRRHDAHRSIRGVVYDDVRLLIGPEVGISMDMRIPIVDLDEDGNVLDKEAAVGDKTGG